MLLEFVESESEEETTNLELLDSDKGTSIGLQNLLLVKLEFLTLFIMPQITNWLEQKLLLKIVLFKLMLLHFHNGI
jgi:hypothetical protein